MCIHFWGILLTFSFLPKKPSTINTYLRFYCLSLSLLLFSVFSSRFFFPRIPSVAAKPFWLGRVLQPPGKYCYYYCYCKIAAEYVHVASSPKKYRVFCSTFMFLSHTALILSFTLAALCRQIFAFRYPPQENITPQMIGKHLYSPISKKIYQWVFDDFFHTNLTSSKNTFVIYEQLSQM